MPTSDQPPAGLRVAEQEIGHGIVGEAAEESHAAAQIRIVVVEVLVVEKIAAEFHGVAAVDPGHRIGVLKVVVRPDLGQVVGLAEIDVAADRDVGQAQVHGVLGGAQESRLRGPVVIAADVGLVQSGAREGDAGFVEQRRRERVDIADAGEQAEGIVGGPEDGDGRPLERIERRARRSSRCSASAGRCRRTCGPL